MQLTKRKPEGWMPTEHKTTLHDNGGHHGVVRMRKGQSAQGEILLKETTIPHKVTQKAIP